jgi:hypothetical protein
LQIYNAHIIPSPEMDNDQRVAIKCTRMQVSKDLVTCTADVHGEEDGKGFKVSVQQLGERLWFKR